MREIPLARPYLGKEEEEAVLRVMRSGWLSTGPEVEAFESEFADAHGANYAIAVNSCTAALHIALLLTAQDADSAIVPAMTFTATANVCTHTGKQVKFADVDSEGLLSFAHARHLLDANLFSVLLPVHYRGCIVSQEELAKLKSKHCTIIQDAAHAPGVPLDYDLGPVCYSLYANKNITSGGEGGMILTNDKSLIEKAKEYRLHGMSQDAYRRFSDCRMYNVKVSGYKYNMTDMQAAMGRVQLRKLAHINKERERLCGLYSSKLYRMPVDWLPHPKNSAHHLAVILINNRDLVRTKMYQRGIRTGVHYPAVNTFDFFKDHDPKDTPNALRIGNMALTLPLWNGMTESDVDYVCENLECVLLS